MCFLHALPLQSEMMGLDWVFRRAIQNICKITHKSCVSFERRFSVSIFQRCQDHNNALGDVDHFVGDDDDEKRSELSSGL